ncbi:MAG TPA: urate oxidase [Jiangellales bacterium]|nr:urate oxidase [Jiangellales bacterium]
MAIVLGEHQYGKAETHLLRVVRDGAHHVVRDLTVSTVLRGDFGEAYTTGDQRRVLPTDTQKNTVFAFASRGVGAPEDFALALARHFVTDVEPVRSARVDVVEEHWARAEVGGRPHDHAFVRAGSEQRTATVTVDDGTEWVLSGVRDLVLLKSTGSEFSGFLTDPYTTLEPTRERVLATSLVARWCRGGDPDGAPAAVDWDTSWVEVRGALVARFATVHSLALQQTLWEMGRAALETGPDLLEIRLSAPNRHHHLVDLSPFGLANPGEVFYASDRPYGLIEAQVTRDDAPATSAAWRAVPGFV